MLRRTPSLRAELTILHVLVPVVATVPEEYLDAMTLVQVRKRARQSGAQQLDKLSQAAKKAGVKASTRLREGDPVEQIIRAARSTRADFIVVGTHGRRGLSKLFVGSVAARVVTTAPCAVMTVRGK